MKTILGSWHIWAMIALIAALLFVPQMHGIPAILPLILILLCPLMMLFMMGTGGHKH